MAIDPLIQQASAYLHHLCIELPNRRVGSEGNWLATLFFREAVEPFGFAVEAQPFDCIDHWRGKITLSVGGRPFTASISPYSLPCDVSAPLAVAKTVEELEAVDAAGKVLLLMGELAKEQLMPKNFTFYNPEEHQHIYRLLEGKAPAAILTATGRNPDAVGAIYPFPMIEDGDFDIPSAYLTDADGAELAAYAGSLVSLKMDARRIPASSENICALKGGRGDRRLVVCAHIDAKDGTPGALDNASGVAILLLLAELLQDYRGGLEVELVALNGEEYYNTPGQVRYLDSRREIFYRIMLAVNLDDIGYFKDRTAYSFYGCPDELAALVRSVYQNREGFFEGPPWFQSDHGIFIANGIPAMAVTEESFAELLAEITHTEKDTPEVVDPAKLAANARALYDLLLTLDESIKKD